MTQYERILAIEGQQPDGTELTLALQSRRSESEWYTVSWRTRLAPGGPNRRFYITNGRSWVIAAETALSMLEQLEAIGGLEDRFLDRERRPDFAPSVSSDLVKPDRSKLFSRLTMPMEDWGQDPFWVVLGDPNEHWRKIMIVNRQTGMATFRSTTTDKTYMPRIVLRDGSDWYLDNSMQDTNVQQAREFLKHLRRIVPKLANRDRAGQCSEHAGGVGQPRGHRSA